MCIKIVSYVCVYQDSGVCVCVSRYLRMSVRMAIVADVCVYQDSGV